MAANFYGGDSGRVIAAALLPGIASGQVTFRYFYDGNNQRFSIPAATRCR